MESDGIRSRVDGQVARWAPGVLRWTAGLLWLANVTWKRPPDFGRTSEGCSGLCRYVEAGADHPVVPGSAWLFGDVIAPNLGAFGWGTLLAECALAVLLISGRFVRVAAVLGIVQSLVIGLAVINAPDEWYWSYLLMAALHLGVLATAPGTRPQRASTMALVTAGYGAAVAVSHTGDGLAGTQSIFNQDTDLPGDWAVSTFPGSVALGLVLVCIGVAGWAIVRQATPRHQSLVGWGLLGVSTLLLLTYGADGLIIGLGSRSTTVCVTAALGLAMAVQPSSPPSPTEGAGN